MRAVAALIAIVMIGIGGGCARRAGRGLAVADGPGTEVAVYRGTLTEPESGDHGFRVTLFVARPDRVHAEIAGPVGGPRLIVDGGGGRIALSFVADRVAYVGSDPRGGLRSVLGLDLGLEDLVGAVLDGVPPPAVRRFEHTPGGPGGWPRRIEMSGIDVDLVLDLRRTRSLPDGAAVELGTGAAAPGLEVRPLAEAPSAPLGGLAGEAGR